MTIEQLISGSMAKFQYAQTKFSELYELWVNQSNKIIIKSNGNGDRMVHVEKMPPDDINMSLMSGDIFHNLRCALEYIYLALYIHRIEIQPNNIQFPSKREHIDKKSNAPFKLELYSLFDLYGDAINLLAEANNQDKHRLLLFTVAKIEPVRWEVVNGSINVVTNRNPHVWHDIQVNKSFDLGTGVRTPYVLVIDNKDKTKQSYITIEAFEGLISDLRLCIETMRQWIIDTTSPA